MNSHSTEGIDFYNLTVQYSTPLHPTQQFVVTENLNPISSSLVRLYPLGFQQMISDAVWSFFTVWFIHHRFTMNLQPEPQVSVLQKHPSHPLCSAVFRAHDWRVGTESDVVCRVDGYTCWEQQEGLIHWEQGLALYFSDESVIVHYDLHTLHFSMLSDPGFPTCGCG